MLNHRSGSCNTAGDVVGKSGVELQYNQMLMGKNGALAFDCEQPR